MEIKKVKTRPVQAVNYYTIIGSRSGVAIWLSTNEFADLFWKLGKL